ncbi:MAG TPA: hypothetical protein VEB65_08300 [Solirubrobacterales bacterium]|nr:hypothetical protein [Solirubrobacterales bacterium]
MPRLPTGTGRYESLMQAADGRTMRRKPNARRLASDARVVG